MPTLARTQPSVSFPSGPVSPASPEGVATGVRWFVLHTLSRQEKALAKDLKGRGIEHFLPLVNSVRYYGKRKFRIEAPLFPGYLFLRGTVEDAYAADRTEHVAQIIRVADQENLTRELEQIRVALELGAPLQECRAIMAGTLVEVVSGPFKGILGVVEQGVANDRLVLQIDLINKAAVLEIDRALLMKV